MKADLDPTDVTTLRAALLPSRSCVSIEQLGRLCDADHAGVADARAAEHVAGCLRCRTELALLKQFESGALRPEEEEDASWIVERLAPDVARLAAGEQVPARRRAPRRPAPGWRQFAGPRALAGGLAVAAAALLVILNVPGREASRPVLAPSAAEGPEIFRSDAIVTKEPAGDVATAPKELVWESAAGAASYSVQLMEVDRTPVWSGETREPRLALPASLRARLVPGKPFLWQVVAKDAAGDAIGTSGMQKFRVKVRRRDSRG